MRQRLPPREAQIDINEIKAQELLQEIIKAQKQSISLEWRTTVTDRINWATQAIIEDYLGKQGWDVKFDVACRDGIDLVIIKVSPPKKRWFWQV